MTAKVRIYELSRELGVSNKDLMDYLQGTLGLILKSHSSSIEPGDAERARLFFHARPGAGQANRPKAPAEGPTAPTPPPPHAGQSQLGHPAVAIRQPASRPPQASGLPKPGTIISRPGMPSTSSGERPRLGPVSQQPGYPPRPPLGPTGQRPPGMAPVRPGAAPTASPSARPGQPPSMRPTTPGQPAQTPGTPSATAAGPRPTLGPVAPPVRPMSARPPGQQPPAGGGTSSLPPETRTSSGVRPPVTSGTTTPSAQSTPQPSQPSRAPLGPAPTNASTLKPGTIIPTHTSSPMPRLGPVRGPMTASRAPGYLPPGARREEAKRNENTPAPSSSAPPAQQPMRREGALGGPPSGGRPPHGGGAPGQQQRMGAPAHTGQGPRDGRRNNEPGGRPGGGPAGGGVAAPALPVITQTAPPAQKPPGAARRERERQKERDRERERLAKLELAATPGGKVGETGATATMTPVLTGPVRIDQPLTVGELSKLLMRRETEIIKHLFMKGVMVTVNQTLEAAYGRTIAKELGAEVDETEVSTDKNGTGEYTSGLLDKKPEGQAEEAQDEGLVLRPPVVSIMGHVDHGKTSLLDAIRETRQKIVDSEAGGITQSIGAYTVEKNDQTIVFLDTPGHEAFTSMRMRGAQATDIAILVVAADDGVMPQTIEAISHAKAAGIPIIVAVNKIDKAGADPEKVLVQLSDHGLVSEKWGGETVTVEVSALQKLGLDDLLEMILLVAELQNLKANPGKPAEGVIIEAQLDKRKGPVATALVQSGTLRVGDYVLMGPVGGRVRALLNDYGQRVKLAGPSTPVEILGLGEVPKAGDAFEAVPDERVFKQRLTTARDKEREERLSQGVAGRTQGFALVEGSGPESKKSFNLIVKADTQGSSEAVNAAILQLSTDEIQVKIIHSGTGDISEADVMLATASQAMILAFNVKADLNAARVAEENTIRIEHFDVIYHLTEAIQKWMLGQLSPTVEEVEAGVAEVRQLFTVGKATVIAGCMVTKGKMIRNAKARVSRNGQELFAGPLDNLKRFKDDAKEVATGYECGISFSKFNDLQEGDLITVYTVEETARTSL